MFSRRFQVFRAFGIPIFVDLSWFVVALLISWSLADNVLPGRMPGLGIGAYWGLGVAATLGLFVSIVLHELAHALVARRFAVPIRGITLFIFGGVAEMKDEPPSARAEFMVAVAGPLASVVVAVSCFGLSAVLAGIGPGATILSFLAGLNLVLVVFNMIPAFPLDGGRVLRSVLWQWRQDLSWATRVTSSIGSGFGIVLIAFGLYRALFGGDLIGGLWSFMIGMFLRNAAQMSYRQVLIRRALEGEPVARFMITNPVTVPRAIPISDLVREYVYRYHFKMFPVVEGGRLLGCVTTRTVKQLPQSEWQRQSVSSILEPCSPSNTISPEADAMQALATMSKSGASRLMVVDGEQLVGILALKDLLKFLSLKVELEGDR
ncbi:MAG: site-2 protease family protein [Thermoanaerobaculia bacterium]